MPKLIFVAAGEEWNGAYMDSVRFTGLEVTDSVRDFHAFPEAFDLVVFTGGADVTPKIYGHEKSRLTTNSEMRDYHEKHIFMTALEFGIPMAGICRGMQWLNCMAGGFMIQHVESHNLCGSHHALSYTGQGIKINSLHHQMCVPPDDGYILAVSAVKRSQRYIYDGRKNFDNPVEVESMYYPNINAFGVQWHPEAYGCHQSGIDFWEFHVKALLEGWLLDQVNKHNPPRISQFDESVMKLKYGERYEHIRKQNQCKAEESI